jgi:hypothetical protein
VEARVVSSYSTPVVLAMGVLLIAIAWLAGVEPWMLAVGAAIALLGYVLERRREEGLPLCSMDDGASAWSVTASGGRHPCGRLSEIERVRLVWREQQHAVGPLLDVQGEVAEEVSPELRGDRAEDLSHCEISAGVNQEVVGP